MSTSRTNPLIVVGGSAGAIAALRELVAHLPHYLPAPLVAVVHGLGRHGSDLARLLGGDGHLKVGLAVDGEEVEPGHLYVAGPDRHLIVDGGILRRVYAAEENRVRPPSIRSSGRRRSLRGAGHRCGVVWQPRRRQRRPAGDPTRRGRHARQDPEERSIRKCPRAPSPMSCPMSCCPLPDWRATSMT